ncbi:MAG: hypothetical protein R6V56_01335 [Lentisphaeria bacterium]
MDIIVFLLLSTIAFSENKTALVIGNSAYRHFPKLFRPWQEAKEVKASLERLGFDVVYVPMKIISKPMLPSTPATVAGPCWTCMGESLESMILL